MNFLSSTASNSLVTGGGGPGVDPSIGMSKKFYNRVEYLFTSTESSQPMGNKQIVPLEPSIYREMQVEATKKINGFLSELKVFNPETIYSEIGGFKTLFEEIASLSQFISQKDETQSRITNVLLSFLPFSGSDTGTRLKSAEENLKNTYYQRVESYLRHLKTLNATELEEIGGDLESFLSENLSIINQNPDLRQQLLDFVTKGKQAALIIKLNSDNCIDKIITPAIDDAFKFLLNIKDVTQSSEITRKLFERFNFILERLVCFATNNLYAFRENKFFQENKEEVENLFEKINKVKFILTEEELNNFTSLTINIEDIFILDGLTQASRQERANRGARYTAALHQLNAQLYKLIGSEVTPLKSYELNADKFRKVVEAFTTIMPQTLVFDAVRFPTLVKWFGRMILNNKETGVTLELLGQSFPALVNYLNMMREELVRFNNMFNLNLSSDCDVLHYFKEVLNCNKTDDNRILLKDRLQTENDKGKSVFPLLSQFLNRSHLIDSDERLKEEDISVS
jgi:hypothetical protein